MRGVIAIVGGAALAWLLRRRLVALLTTTTGTWVGVPEPTVSALP